MDRLGRMQRGRWPRVVAGMAAVSCAVLAAFVPAAPAGAGTPLAEGERGRVASVEDGDSFTLDGGLVVRLAEVEAPRLRPGDPAGEQARAGLAALLGSGPVTLRYGGLRRDRRGRAIAHAYVRGPDGREVWVQQALLDQGLARVHTYADNRIEVPALWSAERTARRAARGVWALPAYQVRFATPEALAGGIGTFQLMEGTVTAVERRGRVVMLGFGPDRDTDVTAVVPETALPLWPGGEAALTALEGRTIRVRGLVRMSRGPSVWVDHPEQIEFIRPAGAGAPAAPAPGRR